MKKPTLVIAVGDKKKEPRKNYLELPEGFDAPKLEDGETFEAVVEIKKKKGGWCVASIDGVPMEKEESGEADEDEPETIGAGAMNAMKGYA